MADPPASGTASTRIVQENELRRLNRLIEELARYKEFIDFLPQIIYEADAAGKLTYINRAAFDAMGVSPMDMERGINMLDLIAPEDIETAKINRDQVIQGIKSPGNEYRLRRIDGTTFEALIFSSPIINEGHIEGIRGIAVDISDKKAGEERSKLLKELSAHLASSSTLMDVAKAVHKTTQGMQGVDCGGLYCADYKCGGLTLVDSWGLGGPFVERVRHIPPDSKQLEILMAGETLHVRHSDISPPGDAVRVSEGLLALSILPVMHEGKLLAAINLASHSVEAFSGRTTAIIDEISDHLGGAISRIQTETEMREQDARYRAIVDNSREVVFVLGPSSLQFMSARIEELTGYSREELRQMDPTALLHPEDRERFAPMWSVRGANIQLPATFEFRVKTKSGQLRFCQAALARITYHGDASILGTVRDITDERKAQQEMLRVTKLDSLSLFAGGIAHDFNNFLAAILGNISLARADASDLGMSGAVNSLAEAEKACERATDLNRRLLTFAKGGAPVKTAASLTEVLTETAGFTLSGSDIAVINEFQDDLWPVSIDTGQISQVVQNLIVNSMHAMAHSRTKRLDISASNLEVPEPNQHYLKAGKYVCLSIRDHGCGIPEEHLPRIFDPFFTTKANGSGLGLATSHSILQQHGGRIDVESKVGEGSTFRLFLPAAEGKIIATRTSTRPISGHGRILVVDDDTMVRTVCSRLGARLGYDMDEAKEGIEAIEKYWEAMRAGYPYDVVILDLTIPGGLGGLETVPKLREINPKCFFVVSSGYSDSNSMAEYEAGGFDAVLAKPYSLDKLSRVLAKREKKP